jgi:hypothetical protein
VAKTNMTTGVTSSQYNVKDAKSQIDKAMDSLERAVKNRPKVDWAKKREEEVAMRHLERCEEIWKKVCPPAYRETEPDRLPFSVKIIFDAWNERGSKGLWVTGPHRIGKTRAAFTALHRALLRGRSIDAVSSVRLGMKLSMSSRDGREEEIDRICKVGVLFLDDLGKEQQTGPVMEGMYLIAEGRLANKLPTIITSNSFQQASMMDERIIATYARFAESCDVHEIQGER